jgi:hypothetical protein
MSNGFAVGSLDRRHHAPRDAFFVPGGVTKEQTGKMTTTNGFAVGQASSLP